MHRAFRDTRGISLSLSNILLTNTDNSVGEEQERRVENRFRLHNLLQGIPLLFIFLPKRNFYLFN